MEAQNIKDLAQQVQRARGDGRLADGRRLARKMVAQCRVEGNSKLLVRALMFSGQLERDDQRLDDALEPYMEAVALSRENDESLRFAHVLRHLADLYGDLGRWEESGQVYEEALAIYRGRRDASPGDLANALRGFALYEEACGAIKEARSVWEEARKLYASLGVDEGVAECDIHLRSQG